MRSYLNPKQFAPIQIDKLMDLCVHDAETHWELDYIVVKRDWRGSGIGTETMKQLLMYATLANKLIYLTPDPILGSSKTRLKRFYTRFGFKPNQNSLVSQSMVSTNL